MKPKHFLFILLFLTFNSFSQSIETLKTSAQKLYESNFLMDFEGMAQLSYPTMVENIGKTAYLEAIEFEYENEEYRLRYQLQSVPLKFGPIKKINNKSFCVVTCRNPVRYFFENKITEEVIIIAHTVMLESSNNTKEIVFEPKRNSFNVKRNSVFLAVADETTHGEWKFFNLDIAQEWGELRKIFGENLINQLGLNK
ncbi:MAG: hypothetical protein RL705_189 [Bacteroidota bacterium]